MAETTTIATLSDTLAADAANNAAAAGALKRMFTAAPVVVEGMEPISLDGANVRIEKGNWRNLRKSGENRDSLEITIQTNAVRATKVARAIEEMALRALHTVPSVRREAILVPSTEYLADIKKNMRALLTEAVAAGIPGSGMDYSAWKGVDPNYSTSQVGDYGAELIEGEKSTTIRLQIPTNLNNPDEASAKANEIAEKLRKRLPQMKDELIKRVKRKSYLSEISEDMQKQLDGHTLEVSTQQQSAQWTSVFIEVRSPAQQRAKDHPEEKTDPETLKKSNLFAMIPEEKNRKKLAGRIALFKGDDLKEPASFFMDVAGTQDIDIALIKVMERLAEKKPELEPKIRELLGENVFKRRQLWNLPADQQPEWKHPVSVGVSPKHPDKLRISIDLAAGNADKIIAELAAMGTAQQAQPASAQPAATGTAVAEPTVAIGAVQTPGQQQREIAAALQSIEQVVSGLQR